MPPSFDNLSGSDLTDIQINEDKKSTWKYVCTIGDCKLRFKRLVALDKHEFSHTGIRKHACTYENCDKKYVISTHLKRHIQVFHNKVKLEKTIPCTICNGYFISEYEKDKHLETHHENPKVYTCLDCGETFKRKLQLRRHMVKHTNEYPYKCEECEKGFLNLKSITRHKRLHTNYKCTECEESFKKWSELVKHRKDKHPSIFKCSTCDLEFKWKYHLRKHEESHQKDDERTTLKCPWDDCEKSYFHSQNLRHHIKVEHEKILYPCSKEGCDKKFRNRSSLKKHLKNHNVQKKTKKPKKLPQKPRSDAGIKKTSFASLLSGVCTNPEVERALQSNRGQDLVIEESFTDITDTDGEERVVPIRAQIYLKP